VLRPRLSFRDWVMDSGAFSAANIGVDINLRAYGETALELLASDPTMVEVYSLDVIGDTLGTLKNTAKLHEMGVLSKIERNPIIRYCQTWSRWKQAELFIQKHGESYPIKDEKGNVRCVQQFPAVATAHKTATILLRLEQEFGLTPASRPNIVASGRQPGDELDDYAASKWQA